MNDTTVILALDAILVIGAALTAYFIVLLWGEPT